LRAWGVISFRPFMIAEIWSLIYGIPGWYGIQDLEDIDTG